MFPDVKPDALKLARGCEDALSRVLYTDDARIVIEHLSKRYGTHEGVWIELREATGADLNTDSPPL